MEKYGNELFPKIAAQKLTTTGGARDSDDSWQLVQGVEKYGNGLFPNVAAQTVYHRVSRVERSEGESYQREKRARGRDKGGEPGTKNDQPWIKTYQFR